MSSLKEIKEFAKVQKVIDTMFLLQKEDAEMHTVFMDFINIFIEFEEKEKDYPIIQLHAEAKDRFYEWASDVVLNKPIEYVKENMEAKDVDWALHTILTNARRVYGEIKEYLTEDDYNKVIEEINVLCGAKKIEKVATQ
jgi:hypothetical protein